MKRCGSCDQWKPIEAFALKKRLSLRRQSFCRSCQHEYYVKYYRDGGGAFVERLRRRTQQQKTVNRAYVVNYLLNHPCVDCGIADPIVLELDHKPDVKKRASVSALMHAPASLDTLKEEIAKCEVRCANCHRRKTSRMWKKTGRGTRRQQENDSTCNPQ